MGALCCKPEVVDFDGPIDLYHFYLLRAVGKGAFGKVRVVQHKQTKNLYALKYINKAKCVKMRAVSNIIQERRLLEEIESPFVCNLRVSAGQYGSARAHGALAYSEFQCERPGPTLTSHNLAQYAFQDDEHMFMVLDLMLGGDLRFHLDRSGNMKEEVVRFYVAELAVGLDYLHKLQIVHRDLKPDNVLLDEKGHAHLTDFNIAVHFNTRRPLTSIAGSMAYMAPEVLAKRGYLSSVDWWSLGVMAYELLFGRRPFRGKTNSALTHAILNDRCTFPENVSTIVSRETVLCVRALLERDPKKRLGCKGGIEDIKAHPWFAGINWDALQRKELVPPFEPDNKKANFDATHELEELLLEDNPLKAKKRNANQDIDSLTPELRQMEEHFVPFDHLKQQRRSYFKPPRRDDFGTQSQISTSGLPLADQPLAEMASTAGGTSSGVHSIVPGSSQLANSGAYGSEKYGETGVGASGTAVGAMTPSSHQQELFASSQEHFGTRSVGGRSVGGRSVQDVAGNVANGYAYPMQGMGEKGGYPA